MSRFREEKKKKKVLNQDELWHIATAMKFCGNKEGNDLPFPWYCSGPWLFAWQPAGVRALRHPSSRCNLCLQYFLYGNPGKAQIKTCAHGVRCSAWSLLALQQLLCLSHILGWRRTSSSSLLPLGGLLQISQWRLVGPLLAAERGGRAAAFTFAALLPSAFVPLGTLYPQQLPG